MDPDQFYHIQKNQRRQNVARRKPRAKRYTDLGLVYQDTLRFCETNFTPPTEPKCYSIASLNPVPRSASMKAPIDIRNMDTLDMAAEYARAGLRPMVLNMASDYVPGGGVIGGAKAQEECLFRRSNAFMSHPKEWYPLKPDEVIYAPDVVVIKDNRYELMPQSDWFTIGMLAVAALRKPRIDYNDEYREPDDRDLMRMKIESIFKIAIENGHDSLVLGALGCGVFRNPRQEVAELFLQQIRNYGGHFKRIGFAILTTNDADNANLETFQRILTCP